jgi:hypothetical protein
VIAGAVIGVIIAFLVVIYIIFYLRGIKKRAQIDRDRVSALLHEDLIPPPNPEPTAPLYHEPTAPLYPEPTTLQHPGSYIPEDERVIMPTAFGICPILPDNPETLHRPSMDCSHTIGSAALSGYLNAQLTSGPFPIRCPCCVANDNTRATTQGIITESPLYNLVKRGVITDNAKKRILGQHILLNPDQKLALSARYRSVIIEAILAITLSQGAALHLVIIISATTVWATLRIEWLGKAVQIIVLFSVMTVVLVHLVRIVNLVAHVIIAPLLI